MQVADELAAAWDLGSRFAEAYALAKREKGYADFDDLISIAGHLLAVGDFGEWVRFKLDQRTDHILVDEAQDTNARQWAIILSLAAEFFAGLGAKDDRVRSAEHTSELQSLMRISYAVFCLKKKKNTTHKKK